MSPDPSSETGRGSTATPDDVSEVISRTPATADTYDRGSTASDIRGNGGITGAHYWHSDLLEAEGQFEGWPVLEETIGSQAIQTELNPGSRPLTTKAN